MSTKELVGGMTKYVKLPQQLINNGIKRDPGAFRQPPSVGWILNLGSGNSPIEGADNLDLPEWRAPFLLGYGDETVAQIHMYHFLEHLSADDVLVMFRECQRVLKPGGTINLVVPHAMCPLAYQAPDHRTFWTEEGLQDTFYSAGYDTSFGGTPWKMDITWMMVVGVKWSNLCVCAQIVKWRDHPYTTPWRRDNGE